MAQFIADTLKTPVSIGVHRDSIIDVLGEKKMAEKVGFELQRNTEMQLPQFLGYPLETWKVLVPDYEGAPARISFESLSELHEHWERIGRMRVCFDDRERTLKELYLASDKRFRATFRRWTEIGGRLPLKALKAIEHEEEPLDWSERTVRLCPQPLLARGGLGEWDELRRRLREFILSVDRDALASAIPLSAGQSQLAKRL